MKNLCKAVLLAAMVLPLAAQAQAQSSNRSQSQSTGRFSYTYGELRYVDVDPDGPGDDFDGLRLAGALQFRPQLFAVGAYQSLSNGPVDFDAVELGVGFRSALQSNVDLVAIGNIVFAEFDAGGGSADDSGIVLTGGVRALLAPQFEVGGYASFLDVDGYGDGDIGLTGEAMFHITPQATLLGSLGFTDDANTLTLGARWNFR